MFLKQRILDNHIMLIIIYATLLVLLLLVGLQIFISFVGELGNIGNGHYDVFSALLFVVEMLPKNIYNFFPMVGLLGSLLGLGYLASHSELIVMRASGMSLWQISWAVIKAAILMLIVMTVIGEVVAPYSARAAITEKKIAESGTPMTNTLQGVWMRKNNNFIHINTVEPGKKLQGVSQYTFDNNHRLISASYAHEAVFQNNSWLLQEIQETLFNGDQVSTEEIPQAVWPININPSLLNISMTDPGEMSLVKLTQLIHFEHSHGLQVSNYMLVLWQRIFQPLATLVMILLAIPFVFGPLRSTSMGSRILIGVVVGFVFYLLNQFFGPLSVVYQIPPILGALTPTFLFSIVAIYLLKKVG